MSGGGMAAPAQKLRPLAHLSIRDQTLATAAMMCLAEAVESAQCDTTGTDILAMRAQGVVSYGNRLQCSWEARPNTRPRAKFSWDNSRTYRQYFQDYRTFLARPRRVCAELMPQLGARRELFVVSGEGAHRLCLADKHRATPSRHWGKGALHRRSRLAHPE
jgi:hypothetical protein